MTNRRFWLRARGGLVFIACSVMVLTGTALSAQAAASARARHPAPLPLISTDLRNQAGKIVGRIALTKQETAINRARLAASSSMSPFDVTSTNLVYHGGPVMRSPVTYAIFWQPPGSTPFPYGYEAGIQRFFQDVGGTPFYNIVTQYGDSSGQPAPNAVSFGGSWTDTNAFPNAGTWRTRSPTATSSRPSRTPSPPTRPGRLPA